MKKYKRSQRILKVFFTRTCKIKFQELKRKLTDKKIEFYHIGDNYSLLELAYFDADIVVNDFEMGEIYVRKQEHFVKINNSHMQSFTIVLETLKNSPTI